jgi:hypothetical protein
MQREHAVRFGPEFEVMGYYRPIGHFNIGKKAEAYSRKCFSEVVAANNEFTNKYKLVTATI